MKTFATFGLLLAISSVAGAGEVPPPGRVVATLLKLRESRNSDQKQAANRLIQDYADQLKIDPGALPAQPAPPEKKK
ncbi:MAG: hypothetical protein ABR915_12090 [Thermoguttaceae bacterium]|jgi:hypothetical protein